MKGVLTVFVIGLSIQLITASGQPPVWTVPSAKTKSLNLTFKENTAAAVEIIRLVVVDDENDRIVFTIASQAPASPVFTLTGSHSDTLNVPSGGLDAETATSFIFVFSANDGTTTVNSSQFTLTVTDVNEFPPVFSPTSYTGSVMDGAAAGTIIVTVTATDADVGATVTYSIIAVNDDNTFTVGSNGAVTVTLADNINSKATPSYTLTVQASDGTSTVTATVTITVSEHVETTPKSKEENVNTTGHNAASTCISSSVAVLVSLCVLVGLQ